LWARKRQSGGVGFPIFEGPETLASIAGAKAATPWSRVPVEQMEPAHLGNDLIESPQDNYRPLLLGAFMLGAQVLGQ
jgi:hypothetical protein